MELAEGIQKIGFRRWYERHLIEAHLYLVSCILFLIVVLASVEDFSLQLPAWELLLRAGAIAAGGALCPWALLRYLAMLQYAQHAAERSVCQKCAVYGGLDLSETARGGRIKAFTVVRCRKCGHEWTIE